MNATSVHPRNRPNLCACGHDLRTHDLTVSPNTCSLCVRNTAGTQLNVHDFTPYSMNTPPPAPTWFPAKSPAGMVVAGGFGIYRSGIETLSASGNAQGNPTLIMANTQPGVVVGMTLYTNPNNPANAASYRIVAINATGLILTLDRPLVVATNSVRCTFAGILGSTMGPGLPCNGQRAG